MAALTDGAPSPQAAPETAIPRARGAWWHAYVCPAHGIELDHGAPLGGRFPDGGARCPRGCRVDTEAVRGAWTVLSHQAWARRIRLLAHRGERAEAVRLLASYAELYADLAGQEHDAAQEWMLRGRLFHQALTDAIWAVNIGHAVRTLAERPEAAPHGTAQDPAHADLAPLVPFLDELETAALAARTVLVDRGDLASNYTAWLNAAGTATSRAAAAARGTRWAGRERWITGPAGLYAHLRAAVGDDGWEWEGSTYYHGFVHRAALLTLRGTAPAELPADIAGILAGMTDALAAIATEGGILPALHDGPYLRDPLALEWLELLALVAGSTPSARLEAAAARARAELGPADDGLDRLLGTWFTGPPLPPRPAPGPVTVFRDAGYAVVAAHGVHALLDFGPHGGSHGHRDKLALYLYGAASPWQPDPGQVPYGNEAFREHYTSTAAHPAFRVDGAEQRECTGRLRSADATSVTAEVDTAYDGVRAVRRIEAGRCHLVDVLTVTADRPRRIAAQLRPGTAVDVQVQAEGPVRTVWHGDAETLYGWHLASVPVTPFTRPGPGAADDPQHARSWVDFTTESDTAVFVSVYQSADRGPGVVDVGLAPDGRTVEVEFADGTRFTHRTED
ncbi:heparinase II/III domain-containing protein [Streptomyces hydrogenans]|uniref:heparinase II/III domain-containing protein n=1 Tax=Streptomyces hydrogenans TaxID=1873719 RepID=UPI0035E2E036